MTTLTICKTLENGAWVRRNPEQVQYFQLTGPKRCPVCHGLLRETAQGFVHVRAEKSCEMHRAA